jgi:cobalt-zinc-cadmium efflux system protein
MGPPQTATASHRRALALTFVLTLGYSIVEAVAGYFTNSLALLADAGHMVADVGGLALALFASWVAQRPATPAKTYGYYRVEILAALLNGVLLFGMAFFILYEAYRRFFEPPEVKSGIMLAVAVVGLGVNLVGIFTLHEGAGESLNVKGAFLEVVSDTLGSIGTIIAALIMLATGWYYADALFSALIGLFILPRTWGVIRQAVNVLLEAAPAHISLPAVEQAMCGVPNVAGVHDLHVWTITSGMDALSAHVVIDCDCPAETGYELVDTLHELLRNQFGIVHSTIQLERLDRQDKEMCRPGGS